MRATYQRRQGPYCCKRGVNLLRAAQGKKPGGLKHSDLLRTDKAGRSNKGFRLKANADRNIALGAWAVAVAPGGNPVHCSGTWCCCRPGSSPVRKACGSTCPC